MSKQDRFRGALFGLAIGDAVGTTLEFKSPDTFTPLTDMQGGGPFKLQIGQWTDDTSMALCLAESLIEKQAFDAHDQMQRYVRWYREGHLSSTGHCFDIGNTTANALRLFEKTGDPFAGSTDTKMAGNGSIMRLAPIPLAYAEHPNAAIHYAAQSSCTTHAAPAAIDACYYLASLMIGALNGLSKADLLSSDYYADFTQNAPETVLCPEIAEIAKGSFKHKNPPHIIGSGYVVKSLEAALWAFYQTDNFRDGCLKAVNLGDDADTTGAVYGQIAGAYYGYAELPEKWRTQVSMSDLILNFADALYTLSQSVKPMLM